MTYHTPQAIIPKFLWKYIIEYVSYTDIINLITVNSHFARLIDDGDGKNSFLENRSDNIAIVKCASKQMNYFWKYAIEHYVSCDNSINGLFRYIVNDLADSDDGVFTYYKIFIKSGEYLLNANIIGRDDTFIFSKPCSTEINGSKSEMVTFKRNVMQNTIYNNKLYITLPMFFTMKHIRFCELSCQFHKHRLNLNVTDCIDMSQHVLYISNCIFDKSELSILSINKSTITNCEFNGKGLYISSTDFDNKIANRMRKIGRNICIEYLISHSTFSSVQECVYIVCDLLRTIKFTNNIVRTTDKIFRSIINNKTVYVASNNKIYNINLCADGCDNISFKHNHFDNVDTLYNKCNIINADNTNTYENCGELLTAQLKIENTIVY